MNHLTSFILTLKFIFVLSFVVSAQDPTLSSNYHVKQDNLSYVFKTLDYSESQLKKYHTSKSYYWYKTQHIFTTQGGSSGNLLNGKCEAFFHNNQLAESGLFLSGLKNGKWNYWDDKGRIMKTENWKKGVQRELTFYNQTGVLTKKIVFKKNAKTIYSSDTIQVIEKESIKTTIRDSLGKPIAIISINNGKLHGKQMSLNSSGEKQWVTYNMGELISTKVTWKDKIKTTWKKIFSKKKTSEKKSKKKDSKQPNEAGTN